jgi:DNA-damage-inducible protein D
MSSQTTPAIGNESFENLKQSNEHNAEFWSARDLQPLLGYSQWRRFEDAIKRGITSCEQSGNNPEHHFAGAGKMIGVGKEGVFRAQIADWRYGCGEDYRHAG